MKLLRKKVYRVGSQLTNSYESYAFKNFVNLTYIKYNKKSCTVTGYAEQLILTECFVLYNIVLHLKVNRHVLKEVVCVTGAYIP